MKLPAMAEVWLSGALQQVKPKLQAITKKKPSANLCHWCFRIHPSYSSNFRIRDIEGSGKLPVTAVTNHAALWLPHNNLHWCLYKL